jgi:cephalosporin-C deacetylase-like acetyl esterase
MRRDIEFDAEGCALRGWLYSPDSGAGPHPAIVMAHGYSAVKEMYLDKFAEVFADAGLAALVFDNRSFGASDGQPRQEIDPWQQVRDYRHAITFARTLKDVDRDRIGVWGSSYSGGHVLVVGAIDRRVKCVVSQVPPPGPGRPDRGGPRAVRRRSRGALRR